MLTFLYTLYIARPLDPWPNDGRRVSHDPLAQRDAQQQGLHLREEVSQRLQEEEEEEEEEEGDRQ